MYSKDINECVSQPGICQNGGTCENLCGSYKCHCTEGNAGYNCDGGLSLSLYVSLSLSSLDKLLRVNWFAFLNNELCLI